MSDEWAQILTEDEQNLAASLADLTEFRYTAVVGESLRIRRIHVQFGGGPGSDEATHPAAPDEPIEEPPPEPQP
jgi:hypothetical protein